MFTFMEVYGRMHSDSTPSLVYGLTSMVAVVTIESMGVTPPVHGRKVTPQAPEFELCI